MQDLDAVVAGVGDYEHVVQGHGDSPWRRELAVAVALGPEHEGWGAVDVQDLDAVVAGVGDGDHAARREERDRVRLPELPVAAAVRSELAGECAVGVEHLDAVVAGVGDGDHAVVVHGNAARR